MGINTTLKATIDGVERDLYPKTQANNVYVDEKTTLPVRLKDIQDEADTSIGEIKWEEKNRVATAPIQAVVSGAVGADILVESSSDYYVTVFNGLEVNVGYRVVGKTIADTSITGYWYLTDVNGKILRKNNVSTAAAEDYEYTIIPKIGEEKLYILSAEPVTCYLLKKINLQRQIDTLEENVAGAVGELKSDLADGKEAIADLADKKITKFYASNLGETNLNDSDNGKIQDMVIYGKSVQDGTPTHDSPVEIQSVVNPVVKVCGKNLLAGITFVNGYLKSDNSGDITYTTANVKCTEEYIPLGNAKSIFWYAENIHNSSEETPTYYADRLCFYDEDKKYKSFISKTSLTKPTVISVPSGAKYLRASYDGSNKNRMICISSVPVEYETEKYMSVTLPYTLNAIPVKSGGNVTIDGQQYIADYVDVERKKLVRCVWVFNGNVFSYDDPTKTRWRYDYDNAKIKTDTSEIYSLCNKYPYATSNGNNAYRTGSSNYSKSFLIYTDADADLSDVVIYTALEVPTETDLTDEQVNALKALSNYYPTTNVAVTSDELDGYVTFNYPLSMANGWNLIKEQLGDTRDYIYDMDLQSAEAYINSEYAVALTELEV